MALSLFPKPARLWASHRYRAWRESHDARGCDVMLLSRAKSGRTWLRAMLSRLYQQHYGLDEAQLIEFDNFHRQQKEVPIVYFTHGHYLRERFASESWRRSFGKRKLLFLARNPCDVAVSEYFQSTKRASVHKKELHGVDGEALSMFDFVMQAPVGLGSIVAYLNAWAPIIAAHEPSMVVRYEDIRNSPTEVLMSIVEFLEAPFSKDEVSGAVDFAAFENLKELERVNFFENTRLTPADPDDPDSFKVRRGKVGGYTDYFDAEQVEEMESVVRAGLDSGFGYYPGA
ncbi:MAG: sulfotransferase domain-containing protein [Myxococcota bacterium]|nr:sulfotransferase domain-containing protein [Myxococcota bacterium]